jgi:hypothetical protein
MEEFEKWYNETFLPEQSVEPSREIKSAVKFAYNEGFYKATEIMKAKFDEQDKYIDDLTKQINEFKYCDYIG